VPARTAAVITWFHPTPQALVGLRAARRDCDVVVVVDNTPGATAPSLAVPADVVYLPSGRNAGLAAALNAGVASLPDDVALALLLDQDSAMPEGGAAALARHLAVADVAIAAPTPWDQAAGRTVDPAHRAGRGLLERDVVITSGMLVRLRALRAVGPFREEFFVDAVDQDICLRLRSAGWRIVQDSTVLLAHELGEARWRRIAGVTLRSTGHPTWRLYAASRNGAVLLREHLAQRPRWAARQAAQLAYWLLTVLLLEPPRARRAAVFARGLADGLLGRCPSRTAGAWLD
jgi:rhamnosyltransferase